LWYFEDSEKLSETAVGIIENGDLLKFVSVASLWEFSIKYSMKKLVFDGGIASLWEMLLQNKFNILPISQDHLQYVITDLPFLHRDPFDRLIIATAKAECMTTLTTDENIHKYDVCWVW